MGAAAVEVTPPWLVSMSGFAARTQRSRGVHDPLFARAVAVGEPGKEPVVLVSIDCIGVDASLTAAVRRGLSAVPSSRVAVVATHTHGGPVTLRHAHLGDTEDRVLDSIVAPVMGVPYDGLPEISELLFGPMARGTTVGLA